MLSESLKINTTLTELNLSGDGKMQCNRVSFFGVSGNDNDQITLLEQKEQG